MNFENEVTMQWYQKQYETTKQSVIESCNRDWFWKNETCEEELIKKLLYMTQLRNLIKGMKIATEELRSIR